MENVQKTACGVILGSTYTNYDDALTSSILPKLSTRHREALGETGEGTAASPRFTPPAFP
ncbi:hypothetical protein E2C01_101561 [Portunus trituberculatus]|uniref:Uncharacterized protein n=1 Tax=Portunus trituberculatus TaxID=210409 RepID=A0A5B7KM87_PORTR|nr:hypothetical protein [Portunus trituberculatus]